MADVQDPNEAITPAGVSDGGGAAISDPRFERLAALEEYYAQVNPVIERLRPYDEDIQAIVEDEGYREFARSARKTYKQTLEEQQKAREAELPPEMRMLRDEIVREFKPALEEVNVLRTERESRASREAAAQKEASEKFQRENLEYAQRLVAEQKLTSEEILELSRYAKVVHDELVAKGEPRFVPLEEAYKRLYGRAEAKAAPAVPKSLRSRSAAPGVPGGSRTDPGSRVDMTKPGNFTNEMLRRINAQRKTG